MSDVKMSHSDIEEINEKERRQLLGPSTTPFKAKFLREKFFKLKNDKIKHRLRPIILELRLLSCVNTNNVAKVQKLLELGVRADSTDLQNRSALHIAVTKGYREIVSLLLQYGADPNKRDMIQNTPLHLAACSHNIAIISLLIDAGADLKLLDLHGRHPLQLAKSKLQILQKSWMHGHIEMIKLKLEVKEVINLMIAVKNAKERKRNIDNENNSKLMDLTLNNLENMKLTINSDKDNNMEEQMSQLLNGLQNFQIG